MLNSLVYYHSLLSTQGLGGGNSPGSGNGQGGGNGMGREPGQGMGQGHGYGPDGPPSDIPWTMNPGNAPTTNGRTAEISEGALKTLENAAMALAVVGAVLAVAILVAAVVGLAYLIMDVLSHNSWDDPRVPGTGWVWVTINYSILGTSCFHSSSSVVLVLDPPSCDICR